MRTWNKYQPSLFRKDLEDFQRTHIIAATREVRPDIVRALFQYMKVGDRFYPLDKNNLVEEPELGVILRLFQSNVCQLKGRRDTAYLHRILLWSDRRGDDPTFSKVFHPSNNNSFTDTELADDISINSFIDNLFVDNPL